MSLDEYLAPILEKIEAGGFTVISEKPLPYGRQIGITGGGSKVFLNIYQGKKGISAVVGGSESPLKESLQMIIGSGAVEKREKEYPAAGFDDISDFDGRWIGSDESGKGDFFGPLVIAAVMADEKTAAALSQEGIKDSKLFGDKKIKELAAKIREISENGFVILEITPSKYNELYEKMRVEGKNLNHLLAWGHARVIEDLLHKAPCRFVIADKFADERFIRSRLMDKGKEVTLVQTPKAERNVAVAAASILARDRFLTKMAKMSEEFETVFLKGASDKVVDTARAFSQKYGKNRLSEVAKVHFKTMNDI